MNSVSFQSKFRDWVWRDFFLFSQLSSSFQSRFSECSPTIIAISLFRVSLSDFGLRSLNSNNQGWGLAVTIKTIADCTTILGRVTYLILDWSATHLKNEDNYIPLARFPQLFLFFVLWPTLKIPLSCTLYNTTCHTLKQVKQNATNNLTLFFRSAFNALSDGVLRFAHCVAP